MAKSKVLIYCQSTYGFGHIDRTMAIAKTLREKFDVYLIYGGAIPERLFDRVEFKIIRLPTIREDRWGSLRAEHEEANLSKVFERRRRIILEAYNKIKPNVVIVEHYPFGRRLFEQEIFPILEASKKDKTFRSITISSIRDILGTKYDHEWTMSVANHLFDAVFVHADYRYVRDLNEPYLSEDLNTPVHYTGYVVPYSGLALTKKEGKYILITGGGGRSSVGVYNAAIEYCKNNHDQNRSGIHIVAGPYFFK
ncbi:MAG: hypothetical protein AB2823_03835 [Candidatus Thiodiazotropha endolucinida]